MGWYSAYIFPLFLDWSLSNAEMGNYRRQALAPARGETLEIGFGTGLNLPHYPEPVTRLTAIDAERMLRRRVKRRMAEARMPVELMKLDASGRLPFADHRFDSVVTTLTLCSIADPAPALSEMRRVLKPDGQFVFFEHGRSPDPQVAQRQDRFNPIQSIIACGCNLNRPIDQLITAAGFDLIKLARFQMPKVPQILGAIYCGVARPDKA